MPRLLWALLFHFYFCNPSHRAGLLSSALPALWLYCSVGFSLLSVTTAVRGQSSGSCEMSHSSDTGQQTYSNYCNNIRNTCFKTLPWKTISFLSDMLPNVCTVFLSVFFFFRSNILCVYLLELNSHLCKHLEWRYRFPVRNMFVLERYSKQ